MLRYHDQQIRTSLYSLHLTSTAIYFSPAIIKQLPLIYQWSIRILSNQTEDRENKLKQL